MNDLNERNCNIIKDLLPSYLENICTSDTRNAVNKHLSKCDACRKLVVMMRETEFISERTEFAEIDYMKKLKKNFIKKGSYISIILGVFILLSLFISINNYNSYNIQIFYLILPCLLIITKSLFPSLLPNQQIEKKWKILTILSILFTCYGICINLFLLLHSQTWISQAFGLFHLKQEQLGPFLNMQLLTILFYLAALYLTGIYRSIRGKHFCFLYMNIYLTCGFITISQILSLKTLAEPSKTVHVLIKAILTLLLEGTVGIILFTIHQKKSCR